jgi:hypothetical protein
MLERFHLLADFFGDVRIAVAAVNNRDSGKTIQVFFTVLVVKMLHAATYQLHGLLEKMIDTRNHIFFLFAKNFLWTDKLTHKTTTFLLRKYCFIRSSR